MFLVQNIYFPYNTIKYFEYGQDLAEGSLAEWSKALVLGTSPKGRGFESHRCQHAFIAGSLWKRQKKCGDTGDRTRGISHAKRALYH